MVATSAELAAAAKGRCFQQEVQYFLNETTVEMHRHYFGTAMVVVLAAGYKSVAEVAKIVVVADYSQRADRKAVVVGSG